MKYKPIEGCLPETDAKRPLDRLLPCPFCGYKEVGVVEPTEYYEEYEVECDSCGARGPWENDKQAATDAWNKRTR